MRKTIVTFGLISGAVSSLLMAATTLFVNRIGFDKGEIVGYTGIVLSFLLVFFGIRSYRDNVGHGQITFARAFAVGISITLISCVCYVVTWEILYFNLPSMHQFMDKYAAYMVDQARASGASQEAIQVQLREIGKYKELYENPLFNVAITFSEPFPVGLLITLISAAILKKRKPDSLAEKETSGSA